MSTVARKPRPFSAALEDNGEVVRINGTAYGVSIIPPGEDGTAAAVLHKADGESYALLRRHDGSLSCDCPDFVVRWEGIEGGRCKHLRAALELGLLDADWVEYAAWSASLDGTAPESWPPQADADRWEPTDDAGPYVEPTEADRHWHGHQDARAAAWDAMHEADRRAAWDRLSRPDDVL